MAKRDWKLLGRNFGRSHNITEYMNMKNNNFVTIIKFPGFTNLVIRKGNEELDNDDIIEEKEFDKYSKSIKYAKAYMRTH